MEDLGSYGYADCDIEQALIALKNGAQLLKYSHKGKPKFYPIGLSNMILDGLMSTMWVVFCGSKRWYKCALIALKNGAQLLKYSHKGKPKFYPIGLSNIFVTSSLLKELTPSGQAGRSKIDGWSDEGLYFDGNLKLASNSLSNSSVSDTREFSSPDISTSSDITASPKSYHSDNLIWSERLHVALDQTNMQVKGSGSDALRVSVSSAPSTSSHGSAADDCDALGDVYIWGEVICDNVVTIGPNKNASSITTRADILVPRPLESNLVLDVHYISCGVRHALLVTRQGEVFSWGEESGGRLGHGVGKDATYPRLVESLTFCSIDFVACGEFHTCAVSMAGELYTWGDGTHYAGLLGHGTEVSHWIPKRISGPLEGLQVASVTCGPWHTALITSTGQLFTFGDGTFGVLGHGNRESIFYPREVESLAGLRTIAVACGVWHTAAVVEVIVMQPSAGKLFTWGDGDKNRLGHGDKEARLEPTCVPALIEYNFQKVACGHSLTLGLTTSGRIFTMGSTVYGQLGNPNSDGKLPCLVGDRLATDCVEEISCGAYHVAVLTSKNEVYTWGKGANGRLGHGDIEDRKSPTPVESLKDRHVKFIACGSNYTSAICIHKWVSGADQSQCSACRQVFGFTRKRHNCYNCGLVHCHACSSKKALQAALAPDPNKPYRVCDSCFAKLTKMSEANNRRNSGPRLSGENKDRLDKADLRLAKLGVPANLDLIKQLDIKAGKHGKKGDAFSLGRSSQVSLLQLREAVISTGVDLRRNVPKPILTASAVSSRAVSPFSRKPSPPRSATPVPTTSGLSYAKSISDSLRKTNELLNQELHKLRVQVESLKSRCEVQDLELHQSAKKAQEAMAVAAEESAKCKAAKEVIKSLTAQIKDMAERLPPGAYDPESLKLFFMASGTLGTSELLGDASGRNGTSLVTRIPNGRAYGNNMPENLDTTESASYRNSEFGSRSRNSIAPGNASQVEAEWIDQYEPGVYITLVALGDGTRDLKRVRFTGEDLGNTKRRLGGRIIEKKFTRNTMFVDQTSHRFPARLPEDPKELFHLHKVRNQFIFEYWNI
ncbi:PH, RCC1 and FYVE domains-containing protein 1 [Orobanche gracilis]